MRWIGVTRWTIGALVVLQAPIHAQTSTSPLPVSLDHIRAALQEPPPVLQVPAASGEAPTFRVEIRQPTLRPVEETPVDPTMGLPSAGELLMDGIEKIRSAAVKHKRSRAERQALLEVEADLAAFCAVRKCPTQDTDRY